MKWTVEKLSGKACGKGEVENGGGREVTGTGANRREESSINFRQ